MAASAAAAAAAAAARERRREQLRRWEAAAAAAAANPPVPAGPPRPPRVRFERAAEFRAVCAGAELAEARAMVRAGGRALLGGANADGISALHQACIDENMEVVQFLVESGADVNQADNEGWTPLHVAAACGCRSIAQYLLEHGADAAAVTSDLELPLEVAEDEGLEELLRAELERRGVDVAAAKRAEEERMLRDTRLWLDSGQLRDCPHPATGASALHVAAAKGYIEVMRLLLAAGYDPDVRDKDGWTPLHAAAHWGVEEACRLLAEHLCDMAPRNNVGQRPCDLADEETLPLLEELQRRQHHLRSQKDPGAPPPPPDPEGAPQPAGGGKHRRSSVCRRSSREKLSLQDQARERVGVGGLPPPPGPPPGRGGRTPPRLRPPKATPSMAPPPGSTPNAPPPLQPPPGGLCRSGSLGALPTPSQATPPARATPPVRRSASSPRLQAPPTVSEPPARPSPPPRPPSPPSAEPEAPRDPPDPPRPRRPFHPPARDEESESQRKARSRLMRQARRATQGVTLTELKAAEQVIGRGGEGRGPEQPIRDEGRRDPAGSETNGPEDAPPPHSPLQPPNGLRPPQAPPAPAFDYQQLFQELWVENERIREQLQEAELALTQTRLELERVTQRQERSAERPARLELERFERRALELKAAELEEELKALSDLRADNQRLKDENAALIRVISKLSK
ncbi:LOW QUALITY PROTEIN: protein phosphatase 1 regulatory subunit 12C [Manacus candei]|uniref:LOW QUALITY PROTEIN: protein phosphatase 1 regulatory subunit 12C n=1 Tax=Manacus candei TaxID=415023 RepID=UPI0022272515|nr:LOW QUALITY PROTEIN: protein phosphatase 1 regulatory subunit 12C [Manacus candei]